ncbi:hypothetical protein FO519_007750 [Halicephalobus sp. NKZ332]|nr:hypothetical protein FO519_007750 [Halicephalobus sp. NKZ332]
MLYPKAIDDEDELPSETDSSSDEEIEATKARKKKKRVATDFSDKFTFSGVDVVEEDHLDGLKKFLEKRTPSSLQNNIEKERDRLKSALAMDIVDEEEDVSAAKFNGEGAESDSDDSLVQEHASTADKVREKSMKIPKNKLKPNEFFDEASSEIVEAAGKQINLAFQEMNLSRPILKAVTACGYNNPTPIQAACIPVALAGRDICACSATGTGKTAAFMLPILERLLYKSKQKAQTRVLVLVPTRELAIQVFQVSRKLAQFTGVEVCLCAG